MHPVASYQLYKTLSKIGIHLKLHQVLITYTSYHATFASHLDVNIILISLSNDEYYISNSTQYTDRMKVFFKNDTYMTICLTTL